MTEKEKMLAGEPYDAAADPQLLDERYRARELCRRLNDLLPRQEDERRELTLKLLGKADDTTVLMDGFRCDYGYNIRVGRNCFFNYNCTMLDEAPITFGDNVFVGPDCGFYTAIHPLDAAERATGVERAAAVTVGSDVWIGGGARVLPGVTIGDRAVIGAGSVVTRPIPADSVAVGNPARVIRKLK